MAYRSAGMFFWGADFAILFELPQLFQAALELLVAIFPDINQLPCDALFAGNRGDTRPVPRAVHGQPLFEIGGEADVMPGGAIYRLLKMKQINRHTRPLL